MATKQSSGSKPIPEAAKGGSKPASPKPASPKKGNSGTNKGGKK